MLRGGNSSDEIPVDYLAYMDGRESYQPFSCVFCLWVEAPLLQATLRANNKSQFLFKTTWG